MSKSNDIGGINYTFRNPFSFGKKENTVRNNSIAKKDEEEKNVEDKDVIELKKPKNKKSYLHTRKSFSISISTDEYNYWKRVAKMNKKSVSALVRDIVNQHTEYEFKEDKK